METTQVFDALFKEWQKKWFQLGTNDTTGWAYGPDWEKLVEFGETIAPNIIQKLREEERNFPALVLYDKIFDKKPHCRIISKTLYECMEGEQGRVVRLLKLWNDGTIKQCPKCSKWFHKAFYDFHIFSCV